MWFPKPNASFVAPLALLALLFESSPTVAASELIGQVSHVVDGDTFDLRINHEAVRIRICGVDSPERGHKDYASAREELRALIGGRIVKCVRVGEGTVCDGRSPPKSRPRIVAQCFIDGADIAAEMIAAGATCDWPKFSGGHYQHVGIRDVCVRN